MTTNTMFVHTSIYLYRIISTFVIQVNKDGKPVYRKKVNMQYANLTQLTFVLKLDRAGTTCRAIPVRVKKYTVWQNEILEDCSVPY